MIKIDKIPITFKDIPNLKTRATSFIQIQYLALDRALEQRLDNLTLE